MRRPWKRCPACSGVCHWHDSAWVCDACGSEWMPPPDGHGPEWTAPDDRPLTDAQERALIALDDQWCAAAMRGVLPLFHRPNDARQATLDVLGRLGLVELQELQTTTVARITEAGRALLASMGD